ncbi:hypothetical protein M569_15880, partial [Genlisea aurea]
RLFVSSWNVGGTQPPENMNLITVLLDDQSTEADIYVFGFQEIVPLNAGNILVPEKGEVVSAKWNSLIKTALNRKKKSIGDTLQKPEESQRIYPLDTNTSNITISSKFECLLSKQMVGVYITIWVRRELHDNISHLSASSVGCGIFGYLGNKGSVSIRFYLYETSFCFVCTHLASGGKKGDERQRNTDATHILTRTLFPAESVHHRLPRRILDHDRVIWFGDLNYRIHLPEATTRSLVTNKEWSILLQNDQVRYNYQNADFF